MGIEERVGREIDALMCAGKTVRDVEMAYRRMYALGAGTYFWQQFCAAFNDRVRSQRAQQDTITAGLPAMK